MFDTRTRLLFFACLKDAAGAALKDAAPAPTYKKIGSGAALKVAAPAPQHKETRVSFIILYNFMRNGFLISRNKARSFRKSSFVCSVFLKT